MVSDEEVISLCLAWRTDRGLALCRCLGHVVEHINPEHAFQHEDPDFKSCWVMVDDVISCRIESNSLTTVQLPVSDMPTDVQSEVYRLIGQTLELTRMHTELELIQYINRP